MKKYIPILLLLASCQSDKFVGKWSLYALLDKKEKHLAYSNNENYNLEITKTEEKTYELKWIELGRIPLNQENENELVSGGNEIVSRGLILTYLPLSRHLILKLNGEEIEEFEKVK
ncbi:MAG: hypothetical protein BGO86_15575 [Chryseobacterium sp. 36-9]|nr:MAG: hypothetical protein BGO86_15575 [Chryseobacterium sp. 36-9]